MYFLPLFDRVLNPNPVNKTTLLDSIQKELVYILGFRTGILPASASSYDIKQWECDLVNTIEDSEPRLKNVRLTVLNRVRERVSVEVCGVLVFDNTNVSFTVQY